MWRVKKLIPEHTSETRVWTWGCLRAVSSEPPLRALGSASSGWGSWVEWCLFSGDIPCPGWFSPALASPHAQSWCFVFGAPGILVCLSESFWATRLRLDSLIPYLTCFLSEIHPSFTGSTFHPTQPSKLRAFCLPPLSPVSSLHWWPPRQAEQRQVQGHSSPTLWVCILAPVLQLGCTG